MLEDSIRSDDKERRTAETVSVVRALYDAFLDGRRDVAESLISPEFRFTSPYDDRIDRAAYFALCWPGRLHLLDFEIECVAAGPYAAFVTYRARNDAGDSFRNTEYVAVSNGKVTGVDVYFGAAYRDRELLPPKR